MEKRLINIRVISSYKPTREHQARMEATARILLENHFDSKTVFIKKELQKEEVLTK